MDKFAIKEDGSYSHYGIDGTIPFDEEFNSDNEPFNHKYVDGKWIVDEIKMKESIRLQAKNKLQELDSTINRPLEDTLKENNLTVSEYLQAVISEKEELRQRIQDNK